MRAADLEGVLRIAESLPQAPQWPVSAYHAALGPPDGLRRIALAAEEKGNLAGFLVASVTPPDAELETIAVAAEAQRRGLGAMLLGALLEELRREDVSELFLEVRASNQAARALYRGHGFTQIGRRANYYADPEEDAVLLGLRVD